MDQSRFELKPGLWLDHRRAAFFEREEVLAVADLHLGYAWAHRFRGQLLPVQVEDPLLERLSELCASYHPGTLAILGDIVHSAVPVQAVVREWMELSQGLAKFCALKFILGNHDRGLEELVPVSAPSPFCRSFRSGANLFLHGDQAHPLLDAETVVLGHEHPAIALGDGIVSAKFPCFLWGQGRLVLPAFSRWASGSDIASHPPESALARDVHWEKAIAICGSKLLPVALGGGPPGASVPAGGGRASC